MIFLKAFFYQKNTQSLFRIDKNNISLYWFLILYKVGKKERKKIKKEEKEKRHSSKNQKSRKLQVQLLRKIQEKREKTLRPLSHWTICLK